MKRPGKIRERIERLYDEVFELRGECLGLAMQLEAERNLVAALEEIVKATAGLRERA